MDGEAKGWRVVLDEEDNCIPINDLMRHELSPNCWCRPKRCDFDGKTCHVHHAADAREYFEPDFRAEFTDGVIV